MATIMLESLVLRGCVRQDVLALSLRHGIGATACGRPAPGKPNSIASPTPGASGPVSTAYEPDAGPTASGVRPGAGRSRHGGSVPAALPASPALTRAAVVG